MQKIPISVVIPVKNEEGNLPHCLSRLTRFEDVVVVDSGSTDRTVEIAASYGATVVEFSWGGGYPKKRNWTLLNVPLRNDWVLFLDADERLTNAFCEEVFSVVFDPTVQGFWLNYRNVFVGKLLKFGVPQRKLALFRVGSGLYERIEEDRWTTLDIEVHEHPVISGVVKAIGSPIEHHDFRSFENFVDRHRHYAVWEANRYNHIRSEQPEHLTVRQRVKYRWLESWWFPWAYFLYAYIVRLGILDGSAGFYHAFYKAWYFLTVRLLIVELRGNARPGGAKSPNGLL